VASTRASPGFPFLRAPAQNHAYANPPLMQHGQRRAVSVHSSVRMVPLATTSRDTANPQPSPAGTRYPRCFQIPRIRDHILPRIEAETSVTEGRRTENRIQQAEDEGGAKHGLKQNTSPMKCASSFHDCARHGRIFPVKFSLHSPRSHLRLPACADSSSF
jgi:hypothetical protein